MGISHTCAKCWFFFVFVFFFNSKTGLRKCPSLCFYFDLGLAATRFLLFILEGEGGGYFSFPPTCVSEVDERKQHKQSGQLRPENVSGDLYLQENERKTRGSMPRLQNSIIDTKKKAFFFLLCLW